MGVVVLVTAMLALPACGLLPDALVEPGDPRPVAGDADADGLIDVAPPGAPERTAVCDRMGPIATEVLAGDVRQLDNHAGA